MAEIAKTQISGGDAAAARRGGVRAGVASVASPWKPASHRQRDRELKRDAVLNMAARLFIERGYGRATLNDVADQLNITKPALYHYFSSKEDILLECYRLGWDMAEAEIRRIRLGGEPGIGKLRHFICAYARLMAKDHGAILVRVDDRELSPEPRAEVRGWKREIDAAVRGFIREGIADGSVRPCDVRAASFLISGSLNWIGHWRRPGGPMTPEEIGDHFADLLLGGLAAAGPETGRTPVRNEADS